MHESDEAARRRFLTPCSAAKFTRKKSPFEIIIVTQSAFESCDTRGRVRSSTIDRGRFMSRWYDVSCRHCGGDIHVHEDWSDVPEYHKECAWYEEICGICGGSMRLHRNWDNPPLAHKECRERAAAKWYDKACRHCGGAMRVHRDWSNLPEYHKDCAWFEKSCEHCGRGIRTHRDWDTPPKFCDSCKRTFAPQDASCEHCAKSFTIPTGTQIRCKEKGWDLPKRCEDCRELFRHKPFKTIRETDWLGNTVFKTYNSLGKLIGESRDEKGFWGDERRRHRIGMGNTTGLTREKKDWQGNPYRETRGLDGQVKSTSRERTDWLGNDYTESTGGSSSTQHKTSTETSWTGRKYRKTE